MLPEFLNVDLELESNESLDLIAQEFGEKVHVLHNGPLEDIPHLLAVEVYDGDDQEPDSIIGVFCDLIEQLPAKGKALWKKSTLRRFDIGVASSTTDKKHAAGLRMDLSPATLKRIAALNAELAITVYPKAKAPAKTVAKATADIVPKKKK